MGSVVASRVATPGGLSSYPAFCFMINFENEPIVDGFGAFRRDFQVVSLRTRMSYKAGRFECHLNWVMNSYLLV